MRYGYKASAEQFGPRQLLDYSALAAELGLGTIAVSDHFQPWRHQGGHTPAVLPWLGAAGSVIPDALLGTSVLTPTMRYHPSIIAQNFATLACLYPDRVFLGVEGQQAGCVAAGDGRGGDHFGVQEGAGGEGAEEVAAVAVGPVHHGCHRYFSI